MHGKHEEGHGRKAMPVARAIALHYRANTTQNVPARTCLCLASVARRPWPGLTPARCEPCSAVWQQATEYQQTMFAQELSASWLLTARYYTKEIKGTTGWIAFEGGGVDPICQGHLSSTRGRSLLPASNARINVHTCSEAPLLIAAVAADNGSARRDDRRARRAVNAPALGKPARPR